MPVRFVITTLKPGVEPADYERWVRERDYALVRTKPNFVSYTVHRIRRPVQMSPDPGWQYIERIEVRSLEQHDRDLPRPRERRCSTNCTANSWTAPRTSISWRM